MFENRVLRRIFGPKREEVAGGFRGLCNEILNLYPSNIIRMIKSRWMRWEGDEARMGETKNVYILVVMPEWKRPLGRPSCRREYNIILDLREVGWQGVDWMHLAQVRDQLLALVNTVMNFQVP
jgi:hypothetical protein